MRIVLMLVVCLMLTKFVAAEENKGYIYVRQEEQAQSIDLKMFNLDERVIIRAFENQLGAFSFFYNASNKTSSEFPLKLGINAKLEDVKYIFLDFKMSTTNVVTIDTFLDYIKNKFIEADMIVNYDTNWEFFVEKVRIDYNGKKMQQQYEGEKEDFYKRIRPYKRYILQVLQEIFREE